MKLTSANWTAWSEDIAYPADPSDYSPAAMERLMHAAKDYVVHMKNVKPQFHALNSIQMIEFRSPEARERYKKAYEKFLMEKAKLEAKEAHGGGGMGLMILVQLLKFRQAAEEEKCEDIVDAMVDSVNKGEAAVASLNFKYSIKKCVMLLRDKYGIDRDKISIIWGGGNTVTSAKKKKKLDLKAKVAKSKELQELFAECNLDDYDLGIANVEEARKIDEDESLRLGAQDLKERQKEIDRFQSGKTLFCFFTLKAGGVGLSLHHSDDLTTSYDTTKPGYEDWYKKFEAQQAETAELLRVKPGKVRRNEDSGYAWEEDIPFIPVRPRRLFGATTYSAIELVQMLGRCPRLSSLSNTPQIILFYRGTIEERVAYIVSVKLKCLRKVVSQRESWEEVILGGVHKDDGGNLMGGDEMIKQIENGGGESEDESIENIEAEMELDNNPNVESISAVKSAYDSRMTMND